MNCGRAREKLTGRNTPPAVRKTKGLRNSREELAHPRWRKEAGGGERSKLSPREATPSHPANRPRVLSRDFLRPDRRWRALGPRRERAHRARGERPQTSGYPGCSPRREKRAAPWETAPRLLAAWPEHDESSTHTATPACSAPPSPQQD